MAINSTFYLDAADLSLATKVYLDSGLLNIAPDGFYGDGTISREQLGGILLAAETCPSCDVQTACFEGLSEEGGSVTYINADGDIVTQGPIFLGDTVTIQYLSIISVIGVVEVVCAEAALRNEIGAVDPEAVDVCLEDLDTAIFIVTSVYGEITGNDVVCNSNNPLDTFDGGDLYYRLSLNSDPLNSKVCQVDADGVLSIYIVCS